MKNKHAHVTAFYLETLLMILVFVAVILMLTQVFGGSRKLSAEAGYLSDAATISESISAAVRASGDEEELIEILNGTAGADAAVTAGVGVGAAVGALQDVSRPSSSVTRSRIERSFFMETSFVVHIQSVEVSGKL